MFHNLTSRSEHPVRTASSASITPSWKITYDPDKQWTNQSRTGDDKFCPAASHIKGTFRGDHLCRRMTPRIAPPDGTKPTLWATSRTNCSATLASRCHSKFAPEFQINRNLRGLWFAPSLSVSDNSCSRRPLVLRCLGPAPDCHQCRNRALLNRTPKRRSNCLGLVLMVQQRSSLATRKLFSIVSMALRNRSWPFWRTVVALRHRVQSQWTSIIHPVHPQAHLPRPRNAREAPHQKKRTPWVEPCLGSIEVSRLHFLGDNIPMIVFQLRIAVPTHGGARNLCVLRRLLGPGLSDSPTRTPFKTHW